MVTKKTSAESSETEAKPAVSAEPAPKKPISPLWWIFGTLLSVVVLIFILGAVKHAMYAYSDNVRFGKRDVHMMDRRDMRESMRDSYREKSSTTLVSGVVTVIDGNTLTVAGSGTTKQVKTTDTTEYYGAAQQVKVNDSVRIIGTTEGEAFTATRVMISRQ